MPYRPNILDLDTASRRFKSVQVAQALAAKLINSLGGSDRVDEAKRYKINQLAVCSVLAEDQGAKALMGHEGYDFDRHAWLLDRVRYLQNDLGLTKEQPVANPTVDDDVRRYGSAQA